MSAVKVSIIDHDTSFPFPSVKSVRSKWNSFHLHGDEGKKENVMMGFVAVVVVVMTTKRWLIKQKSNYFSSDREKMMMHIVDVIFLTGNVGDIMIGPTNIIQTIGIRVGKGTKVWIRLDTWR